MVAEAAPDKEEWRSAVEKAKRLERTDLDAAGWQRYGFATHRAAEFDELAARGDEPPNVVPRWHTRELPPDAFWQRYERTATPCLIAGIPEEEGWPAWGRWTVDRLLERFADTSFKVGKTSGGSPIRLRCDHFARYMREQADDSPLYMFDNRFGVGDVRSQLLQEFSVPRYFPDDYMALAGEDGRPPYRWVAIGPRRSGTVMHQDPLNTSAWNTLLYGRKRWVLLPPETPKSVAKGKHVMQPGDDDEAVNVFLDLLPRLRAQGVRMVEFVQYPGETIFLPGGWWHCVINVDDTVAVTQNYAGRYNFPLVWRAARKDRPCWSNRWLRAMTQHQPGLAQMARQLNQEDGFDMEALLRRNRKRLQQRRERAEERALRRAKRKAGPDFDEAQWRRRRREEASSSETDTTVSSSSSSSETSSSDATRSTASRPGAAAPALAAPEPPSSGPPPPR